MLDRPLLIVTTDSAPATHPPDRPRVDLTEFGLRLRARIAVIDKSLGAHRGTIGKVGLGAKAFWAGASASKCSAILTTSEVLGLPVAAGLLAAGRPAPHVMMVHKLHTPTRLRLLRIGVLNRRIDRFVAVSRSQAELVRAQLRGSDRDKVVFIPRYVDTQFFQPSYDGDGDYVLAVGLELRDYATLVPALARTGVPAVILASSAWDPKGTRLWQGPLPENVRRVGRLSYPELRDLYAKARFVVLPLVPTVQAAGSTTALEAMAMGKAVLASHVPGIEDYVLDGLTGVLVPPQNVGVLAEEIVRLWNCGEEVERLGRSGRHLAEREMSLEAYVAHLLAIFAELGIAVEPGTIPS